MYFYRILNLSKCSLNLVEIPKHVGSMIFADVFETCVKYHNMIPIAVYKRHSDDNSSGNKFSQNQKDNKPEGLAGGSRTEEKTQRKSYVWLHPPRKIELSIYDELFVLCERNERDDIADGQKAKTEPGQGGSTGSNLKNEGKKIQNENLKELTKLNTLLKELQYSSSELQENIEKSGELLQSDLDYKIKSGLEAL